MEIKKKNISKGYIVEFECGNTCGSVWCETLEEAKECAEELGCTTKIRPAST